MRIMGLSKPSERRVPASHGKEKGVRRIVFQLKFTDEAQLRGNGLITPKVLSPRCTGSGRTVYSRSEPVLSYLTRHVSSFASPTVSMRLESVGKHGRYAMQYGKVYLVGYHRQAAQRRRTPLIRVPSVHVPVWYGRTY